MKRNIVLLMAYDGGAFHGWQASHQVATIEGTLQPILERILQHRISLQAASRTDAGVHAAGQVVNFFTDHTLDISLLHHTLNSLLPATIRAIEAVEVPQGFHPTTDATGKEYHYRLDTGTVQMPLERSFSWHCPRPIDIELMRKMATHLIGTHNFRAFKNADLNERVINPIKTISRVTIDKVGDSITVTIRGDHFLYKMVRNIVGTLVAVGSGKLTLDEVLTAFAQGDRTRMGMTAPAHGLTLAAVYYREPVFQGRTPQQTPRH